MDNYEDYRLNTDAKLEVETDEAFDLFIAEVMKEEPKQSLPKEPNWSEDLPF